MEDKTPPSSGYGSLGMQIANLTGMAAQLFDAVPGNRWLLLGQAVAAAVLPGIAEFRRKRAERKRNRTR